MGMSLNRPRILSVMCCGETGPGESRAAERTGLDKLLEASLSVDAVKAAEAAGAREAHDLRTRHAGRVTFIDFHLVVDGTTPVIEAHDICDRIERALKDKVPDAMITIHVEPENKAKHSGVLVI